MTSPTRLTPYLGSVRAALRHHKVPAYLEAVIGTTYGTDIFVTRDGMESPIQGRFVAEFHRSQS